MSKGTRNVPALRFKGVSDAWEKRKLIDQLSLLKDGTHGTHKDGNFAFLLSAKNVIQDSIVFDDSDRKISEDDFNDIYANYHIKKNDVLLTIVGTIGRVALFPRLTVPVAFQRSVAILRTKPTLFPYFLALELQTPTIQSKIKARANMSAQAGIYLGDLKKVVISIPKSEEQIEIAMSLNRLTNLIAATQDKLEKLSILQRGFLQHFFAQTWRFSGYSHVWENHRLGDVATRVRGNDGRMNLPILTISAGKGWLTQEQRFSQNIAGNELKKYTLLSKGELSYNHGNSKLAEYGAVFVLKQFKEALVPRVYHSFNVSGKADPDFIEYLFESGVPNHELRKLISSGARMDGLLNINYDSFMNISVLLPSIEEQNKIARVLEKLKKLTDETRLRLFNLQQAKKSLLRMLFP
ncbi:restriction endonuclease subunit S [Lacticaseibacillus rhamnosus]|uniref:restriction endonuclease subunit S n=1 Tax=Lacticaseibacillus rhamnosus TaxID=47715 RepID=UPI0003010D2C|nr:restriction endonuclease subunit S [Lacticaseibacillus rhamnosus]